MSTVRTPTWPLRSPDSVGSGVLAKKKATPAGVGVMRAPGRKDGGARPGAVEVSETRAAAAVSGPVRRATRQLRDRPFALRLQKACDDNHRVPAYNHGRQAWVRAQLEERFDVRVSNETVSKWFTGVTRPRPDKIQVLARLLEVDEAWLALGVAPDLEPRERKVRNAMADGVVNVLAGFIQMSGGHPAFPDGRQTPGARVDLFAIIKGAHYALHVALGQEVEPGVYRFNVEYGYEERVVIGVVQREPLVCDFLELKGELIERHGVRRSGVIEVIVQGRDGAYHTEGDLWPRIKSFAERF